MKFKYVIITFSMLIGCGTDKDRLDSEATKAEADVRKAKIAVTPEPGTYSSKQLVQFTLTGIENGSLYLQKAMPANADAYKEVPCPDNKATLCVEVNKTTEVPVYIDVLRSWKEGALWWESESAVGASDGKRFQYVIESDPSDV